MFLYPIYIVSSAFRRQYSHYSKSNPKAKLYCTLSLKNYVLQDAEYKVKSQSGKLILMIVYYPVHTDEQTSNNLSFPQCTFFLLIPDGSKFSYIAKILNNHSSRKLTLMSLFHQIHPQSLINCALGD